MPNRLANAASPYLRQHADNPVDWYEWGPEAFERAKAENKPIFLSVGYSSCHWCHVMAHESFEDATVAAALNDQFVSIKVDREERPDVDSVYMDAVQAMTGRGGWPMSVFCTPDGTPFYCGTYWPRDDRMGMPGFTRVVAALAGAWRDERDKVVATGQRITSHLLAAQQLSPDGGVADAGVAERAAGSCVQAWDRNQGGFGAAPKFPQAMTIDFLLAHHLRTGDAAALEAAGHSLDHMARGGIYDHLAGGFARYSTDDQWLVPHFEKMLYDNALLLRAYTHAWQVTGVARFRRVVVETADYLLRELRHRSGGFYSATDADSEGVEGKFFVWTLPEFTEVVSEAGEDPDFWAGFFDVSGPGNWEGTNILHEPAPRSETDEFHQRYLRVRSALYARRETRVHPGLDDKVLTSWNALALGALAEAGAALGIAEYVDAAAACARFLRDALVVDGRLHHSWSEGHGVGARAFLEDTAFLAQALLVLYEATFEPEWLFWAAELAAQAEERFAEDGTGAYFATAHDAEQLLTRPKDLWDNALPAGSSVMVDVHLRLGALSGEPAHLERAEQTLRLFAPRALQAPTGYGELLRGLERKLAGPREVAVVGDPADVGTRALVAVYREGWRPGSVLAVGRGGDEVETVPLLQGRTPVEGQPAAYVCEHFACQRPVTAPQELRVLLAG